jgi:hypothetical protein
VEPMYTAHFVGVRTQAGPSPCTKLDRLARSLPDARDIADELTRKGVALSLGGSVYDPLARHVRAVRLTELAELFRMSQTTVYHELQRAGSGAATNLD